MLKQFLSNTSGNVAMMFGIASTLLLLGVGVAVDYSGMSSARTLNQSLADAAVLAAARSGEENKVELQRIAEETVAANNFDGTTYNVKLNISSEGFIRVDVSTSYNMAIMGLFGKSTGNVRAAAESPLASDQVVEIALVLDTTGSMSGTKIESLKTAAHALIDAVDDPEQDNIRISVVPFAQYVNVGVSRRNEAWITVDADTSTTGPNCYEKRDVISKENCTIETRPIKTCYNDGVPYQCGGDTYTKCDKTYGEPYEFCSDQTVTKVWKGCVGSRNAPWNERARAGVALIPGLSEISNEWPRPECGEEIQVLTNNMDLVRTKIDALSASGNTYIPAGLIWGWRTLNNEAPLTEAASNASKANVRRVLVLMTDGANLNSADGETHTGTDVTKSNVLTGRMCANVKADKVEMFTVAYEFDGVDTLKVLRNCASKKENYYLASNASELKSAFEDIAESLTDIRISN